MCVGGDALKQYQHTFPTNINLSQVCILCGYLLLGAILSHGEKLESPRIQFTW